MVQDRAGGRGGKGKVDTFRVEAAPEPTLLTAFTLILKKVMKSYFFKKLNNNTYRQTTRTLEPNLNFTLLTQK